MWRLRLLLHSMHGHVDAESVGVNTTRVHEDTLWDEYDMGILSYLWRGPAW
jgi:hypothetical protein